MKPVVSPITAFILVSLLSGAPARAQSAWGEVWRNAHPHEASEINEAALRAERDNAQSLFDAVRHMDLSGVAAGDKLRQLGADRNEVERALRQYEKDKADEYLAEIVQPGTSLLDQLRSRGQAAQYLLSALSQGNPLMVFESYFFSFLLDSQGLAQEADYYFRKAEYMKRLAREHRRRGMARPLEFELPSLYDRLGMPRYTPEQLRAVRFLDDEAMKEERYLALNELDGAARHARLGGFFHYDTNVLKQAAPGAGIGTLGGTAQLGYGELGIETSRARDLQMGVDLRSFIDHHVRDDLGATDSWTAAPAAWLSIWNVANNELRLRYDYALTMRDRSSLRFFSQTQGPQLAWAHLWEGRYHGDVLYSYKRNFYPADASGGDQLSGPEHSVLLKLTYPGASSSIQPFAAYGFDHYWAYGNRFQSNTHSGQVGTSYLVGPKLALNLATEFDLSLFPNHEAHRTDRLRQVRLGAMYRLLGAVTLALDVTYSDNQSNVPETYSFRRWNVVLGPVFGAAF